MTTNGTIAVSERSAPSAPTQSAASRVDWVDYAKGICIVMVVMMHSVLGTELAAGQTGFMHVLVAFAKPFRMPDFFLISGLFLSVVKSSRLALTLEATSASSPGSKIGISPRRSAAILSPSLSTQVT